MKFKKGFCYLAIAAIAIAIIYFTDASNEGLFYSFLVVFVGCTNID